MAHQLAPLPYGYDALEPHIDTLTMQIHHDKHHAAYVNNLNAALEKHPELQARSVDDLLGDLSRVPEDIRTAVRNNGGGHVAHTMFWEIMGPKAGGARECDQVIVWQLRCLQGPIHEGCCRQVWQRVGVAGGQQRQADDREHGGP